MAEIEAFEAQLEKDAKFYAEENVRLKKDAEIAISEAAKFEGEEDKEFDSIGTPSTT